jgi:hypothetical protein
MMVMRTKFPVEKIDELVQTLTAAPELPARFVTKEAALAKLAGPIREMYDKKNYEPRQIVGLLKENGVQVTIKDVREIVTGGKQTAGKKPPITTPQTH